MRHIAYTAKLVKAPHGYTVEVRITEQTHRETLFGTNRKLKFGTECFYHGGLFLLASAYPYYSQGYGHDNVVYLRGWDTTKDSDKIVLPLPIYAKFKAAVLAYNENYR